MPDATVSKKFHSHSSLHLELVILEYCQFSEITSSRWLERFCLLFSKLWILDNLGLIFGNSFFFILLILMRKHLQKKTHAHLPLVSILYAIPHHLQFFILKHKENPFFIPNKYIVVQWFSHTFQQWLYYVYKFFSYDDDAKTAYFKATKCILFT